MQKAEVFFIRRHHSGHLSCTDLVKVKIFCNYLMFCRNSKAELLSNITYAQSSLSNAVVTDLHSIHFLWPSFSVVFKNNNPFIFIPLMPSVNHCPRHMWAISSSIQSFKHWSSMFAGKGFKNLLYVGVSLRWHRYLSWALCWWSIVKELNNCTRSWKNDFIFLFIKMGMISNILLIILSGSITSLHQMVMNIIHVKK